STLDCTLWLNSSGGTVAAYGNNASVLNATSTTITANATLSNDDYWWWINCSDGTNSDVSEQWNISVYVDYNFTFLNSVGYGYADGTLSNTIFNISSSALQLNDLTSNGSFLSQIFNVEDIATWNNISWVSSAIGELPSNRAVETTYGNGNINMTGNVLLLHFNNDSDYGESNAHFYDFSGGGHNGTNSGTIYYNLEDKKLGAASINLSGVSNYVSITDNPSLRPNEGEWTISVWAKPPNVNQIGPLVAKRTQGGDWDQYVLAISGNSEEGQGLLGTLVDTSTGLKRRRSYSSTDVADGNWHHYSMVANKSADKILLYFDGQALPIDTSLNSGAWPDIDNTQLLRIGEGNTWGDYNGLIDEVAMWNRSLSADEILASYKRGITRLNLTARSCDDSACSGESFTDITDTSPQTLSLTNNQYFQYNVSFETDNVSYSPELYNVSISYSSAAFTAPAQSGNDGSESTNLSSYNSETIQAVSNFVWHKANKGKIKFKQNLNLSGISNLDNLIKLDTKFFSVYSTTEPRLNQQANITFENVSCDLCNADNIIYSSGEYATLTEIQSNGQSCSLAGKCSAFSCDNPGGTGNCTFDVTGFTGYAYGGNANLTINDSVEGSSVSTLTSINFFAYYVNATSGAHLSSASCNISFDDAPSTWYAMTEDANRYNYTKSSGFSTAATHVWNVSCAKTGFTTLVADDTVVVTSAGGAVPEFSDYAILLILVIAVGGFFMVRRKENL
ncbi:MAG: LamG domain-containing protein, partial [Nanoarchaeota archaeon]|nr:LamG domain-containing protein [Nanoarchaeota archaeon]